jgi:hypothetical protein
MEEIMSLEVPIEAARSLMGGAPVRPGLYRACDLAATGERAF